MDIKDQRLVIEGMSDNLMLCMWTKMQAAREHNTAPVDLTTQNMLRDELLRRGVIRMDPTQGKYVVVRTS